MSGHRTTLKIKAHELRAGYEVVGQGEVEFVVEGLSGKGIITVWYVDVDDPKDVGFDDDVVVFADDVDY
jgi:hypothetical protein